MEPPIEDPPELIEVPRRQRREIPRPESQHPEAQRWSLSRNSVGLDKAFNSKSGVSRSGDTLFVSGTRPIVSDIGDDINLVTTRGESLRSTPRYRAITKAVDRDGVTNLSGHSLGAATVHQWMVDHDTPRYQDIRAHIYDTPIVQVTQYDSRISDSTRYGDPVSLLDVPASRSIGWIHQVPKS